jgi:pilus assembly protein CpaB
VQTTRKILSTREGTLAVAAVAALLAVAVILTFIHGYKHSVDAGAEPVTVLVAKDALPKGSSGDQIARKGLYQATGFKRDQVKDGAITDPGALQGLVATHVLVPGQQLTTADFAKPSDPVLSQLADDQRAVTLPLDSAHGMIGQIQAGDHVDVYAGFNVRRLGPDGRPEPGVAERPVLKLIVSNVQVLEVPQSGSGGVTGGSGKAKLTVRAADEDIAKMAFTSDNGILWAVLRPRANASTTSPDIVSLETVLFGIPPVAVERSLGGKR